MKRPDTSNKLIFILVIIILFLFMIDMPALANPYGTETLIPTNSSTDQRNAVLYGTSIVWDDPTSNAGDIFLYDIATGNVSPVSQDPATQQRPGIFSTMIVWKDYRIRGSGDIFLFDTSGNTLTRITDDNAHDPSYPRLYGDKVVWQDDRNGGWDIYMFNLTESREYLITPGTPGSDQEYPAVFDNRIVWQDKRNSTNGDIEIFMNDTSTWTESLITPDNGLGPWNDGSTEGALQESPDIWGDEIVWEDNRNQDPSAYPVPNIYQYEFGAGEERISDNMTSGYLPGSYGVQPVMYPSIDGNRIVWTDYRNQFAGDIYLNDTVRSPPEQLLLSTGSDMKSYAKISGDRIVWTEETAGISKIHLFTLGTPQVCPVITFTENSTGGGAPLGISFTDTTTITRPSHWYWDFGDGTVSYEQNPAHVFSANGLYLVNLTVSDDLCRNISANQVMTVGSPAANFIAAPTSGLVPLYVRFNDTSTGSPAAFEWDFENDGIIDSVDRNTSHVYTVPGTYAVKFNATNAFGTGTRIRNAYITALAGAHSAASLPIEGIIIDGRFGGQFLTYNGTMVGVPLLPSPSILISHPLSSYGWQNITFTSSDAIGFSDAGNGTYFGNVSVSSLRTTDIPAAGFSPSVGDPVYVSDRMTLYQYPSSGSLDTEIWEGVTASDRSLLSSIALSSQYFSVDAVGYSSRFIRNSLGNIGTSTINMSISSAWVAGSGSAAAGRAGTFVIVYGTDPSNGNMIGTVLATRYICSDGSLDYFEADIPAQYSYFTNFYITKLSGSGNPLQLITLSVTSHVNPPEPSNPSSESDSGMSGGSRAAAAKTPIPTNAPTPPPTNTPPDPGKSVKVFTNAQGVVSQAARLPSTDGLAIVSIGEGVVAKDAGGKPLAEITIKSLLSENLPAIPSGSAFMFAGMAYEIGPDGATFSPPVTLTFTLPQAQWGQDYTVKSFDQTSGTWQDLPTSFDAATGIVTVQVSHLCCFALFTEPRASSVTPAATPVPVPSASQVKSQPPTTAVSIFMSMMGWVAGLVMNNVVIIVAVIFLIIAIYLFRQGWFPGSGR